MKISYPWKTNLFYGAQLSAEDRDTYSAILKGLRDWQPEIAVPRCPSLERLSDIHTLVLMDVPMFYHVSGRVGWYEGVRRFVPDYVMTEKEYADAGREVIAFFENVRRQLEGRSGFDKLRILHDAVINHVIYHDSDTANEHNILGAVVDRKAVCESIAKAYKTMCDAAQIPAIVVFGYGESGEEEIGAEDRPKLAGKENHAWNLVKPEDCWYQADVTFDLTLSQGKNRKTIRYDYFLRSDRVFSADHISSPRRPVYPCPADHSMYRMHGCFVSAPGDLRRAVGTELKKGGREITVEVDEAWPVTAEELAELTCRALAEASLTPRIVYGYNKKTRVFRADFPD